MSFFRYPGGKKKLRGQIIDRLSDMMTGNNYGYREPFFGAGSIGLQLLSNNKLKRLWINDLDIGVYCLWKSVIDHPESLINHISNFTPSIDAFDTFKADLISLEQAPQDIDHIVSIAFKKIAIHQISYSGLGVKSGGPLGGRCDENFAGSEKLKYPIDCRWSPVYICKKIRKISQELNAISLSQCTNLDFGQVLNDSGDFVAYIDPPYYVKGNDLYQCGFTTEDHVRLSAILKDLKQPWLLSYDDCPEIRQLYSWAKIEAVNVNYSITATKNKQTGERTSRQKPELLITRC